MKQKDFTIPLILLCLLLGALPSVISWATDEQPVYTAHECIDKTHQSCDGRCECDGLGCFEDKRFDTTKKY